jgi:hypothetical protein
MIKTDAKINEDLEKFRSFAKSHPDRFALMTKMVEIQVAKGHDYSGQQVDDLQNLRESEKLGIPGWLGIFLRMGDKWARLSNFAKSRELKVKDENVEDTLLDLSIYALLGIILWRESKGASIDPTIGLPMRGTPLGLQRDEVSRENTEENSPRRDAILRSTPGGI